MSNKNPALLPALLHSRNWILALMAFILVFAFENCGPTGPLETDNYSSLSQGSGNCALAPAELRSPTSIDQVTQLINALPKPLSVPCLIENLPVPLKVYAVDGARSAQPSAGADSPRIFIMRGNLVLSVVPAGSGRNLLEYGQFINDRESVKAELTFPINQTIQAAAPYNEISANRGTTCRGCHTSERAISGYGGNAFVSLVIRPDSSKRQAATRLRSLAVQCNKATDPYRCEMLSAIYLTGQAQDAELP